MYVFSYPVAFMKIKLVLHTKGILYTVGTCEHWLSVSVWDKLLGLIQVIACFGYDVIWPRCTFSDKIYF